MEPDLENDRVIGAISVGRGTYWANTVQFLTFHAGEQIRIGRYSSIADQAIIAGGGDHRPELPSTWPFDNFLRGLPNPTRTYRATEKLRRGTIIGSDVWIGYGAHILAGVEVGHGAVVASRAVVFSDVPPYAMVVGNPAKPLRYRFSRGIIAAMLGIAWWEWSPEMIKERHDWFYEPVEKFVEQFNIG